MRNELISQNLTGYRSRLESPDPVDRSHLVLRETFTGDGIETQFQLDGTVGNASFISGWAGSKIVIAMTTDITGVDGKPTYDGIVYLLRNRLSVISVSSSGLVTLSHPPRSGVSFYIWYWYNTDAHDIINDYTREDYVASMEGDSNSTQAGTYETTSITETIARINIGAERHIEQTVSGIITTLPASPVKDDILVIMNYSGGINTLDGNSTTITGLQTVSILDGEALKFIYSGSDWRQTS